MRRLPSYRASSAQVGFFVIELEIDQRAQHLEIRDQGVDFGRITRPAVEISNGSFWVALLKGVNAGIIRVGLGLQIGFCVGDLFVGIGNADCPVGAQMGGDIVELDFGLVPTTDIRA